MQKKSEDNFDICDKKFNVGTKKGDKFVVNYEKFGINFYNLQ